MSDTSAEIKLSYHEIRALLVRLGHITGASYRLVDGASAIEKLSGVHDTLDVNMISPEEFEAFNRVIGGPDRAAALLGPIYANIQERVR